MLWLGDDREIKQARGARQSKKFAAHKGIKTLGAQSCKDEAELCAEFRVLREVPEQLAIQVLQQLSGRGSKMGLTRLACNNRDALWPDALFPSGILEFPQQCRHHN